MAEASFSAYLFAFLKGKKAYFGHFEAKKGKREGIKRTTKIGRGALCRKMHFLSKKCLKGRQKTRPWPYLYIERKTKRERERDREREREREAASPEGNFRSNTKAPIKVGQRWVSVDFQNWVQSGLKVGF